MFLYIRKYEIWFFVEIFLQKLIHMDKPQTPPPPYVDLCGYFTNPLPPPSQSTWFVDVPLVRFSFTKIFLSMIFAYRDSNKPFTILNSIKCISKISNFLASIYLIRGDICSNYDLKFFFFI